MVALSQVRADRTRRSLLRAAAAEFATHGYEGTSLVRISKRAGVTMGALTFHFPTKDKLADAVCAHATSAARTAVEAAHADGDPPLQTVVNVTHALADLLRGPGMVRAAARLCRDDVRAECNFSDLWLPSVHRLVLQAHDDRTLHPRVPPDVVTALVIALISTLELSDPNHRAEEPDEPSLTAMWDVLLPAISRDGQALHPHSTAR